MGKALRIIFYLYFFLFCDVLVFVKFTLCFLPLALFLFKKISNNILFITILCVCVPFKWEWGNVSLSGFNLTERYSFLSVTTFILCFLACNFFSVFCAFVHNYIDNFPSFTIYPDFFFSASFFVLLVLLNLIYLVLLSLGPLWCIWGCICILKLKKSPCATLY